MAPFRILSAPVRGGSLVIGTSLDQVTETTSQVEAIVVVGSVAVVLLIGLSVFFVMRRGLRPIEAMARQADRITGASHELRTPLASLRANAQLAQQGALRSPDEVDEVMDRIVVETRRMVQLVDDMLRLARLLRFGLDEMVGARYKERKRAARRDYALHSDYEPPGFRRSRRLIRDSGQHLGSAA